MSRAASQPAGIHAHRARNEVRGECLEIVWDLAAHAGRALARERRLSPFVPQAIALRARRRTSAGLLEIMLDALTESGDRAALRVEREAPGTWIEDESTGLLHVEAGELLRATVRRSEPPAALFARTELLEELGLPAGSYAVREATLRRTPPRDRT